MTAYKKENRIEGKYVYRDFCTLIFVCIASLIFIEHWHVFVMDDHNQTGHLLGYGNQLMAVMIFAFDYYSWGKYLKAFKIGVDRKSNLLAGQMLAVLMAYFFEIFISCAITGQFRYVDEFTHLYLHTFLVTALINCVLTLPMVDIYRKVFPPLQMIEIYGSHGDRLSKKINTIKYKYHISECISCDENEEVIREKIVPFDAVLINDLPAWKKNRVLKMCFSMNKRVYFVPKISDILVKNSEELNLFDTPLFLDRNHGMRASQRFFKRFFDIVLSGFALVVLSPLFLITAIAIKCEDHGPVFFKQERVTLNGRHFMILKFRSMVVGAEKDGKPHPAGEKDDRITKVGRIIRACRIDELPQLINILKGDMSIVGPRPERWEHCELYRKEIPEWDLRNKMRGGLTGYAQVYGKYNTSALDKLKLDLIYITHYSLLLDVQIIFETVKILFHKDSTEGFTEAVAEEIHDENYDDDNGN